MEFLKSIYYKLLHFITLGKGVKININGFKLRFPTRYYRSFPADYEKDNYKFLRDNCKKNNVVIDVGAHIGLFSVCTASLTGNQGKIYAFEPTPSTFDLMQLTIKLNHLEETIFPVKAAVADKKGKTKFYMGSGVGDVANSLVNYNDNKHLGYDVDLISLDEFVVEKKIHVDFIKIDAEGAELSVLKGAKEILKSHRPVCILAMHPDSITKFGDSNETIWNYILDFNYSVYHNDKLMDKEAFCRERNLFDVYLMPA